MIITLKVKNIKPGSLSEILIKENLHEKEKKKPLRAIF